MYRTSVIPATQQKNAQSKKKETFLDLYQATNRELK